MILEPRARQLPDESVVMRYPTRAYQTDQPSACRPFCYQHIVRTRTFYKPLDRSNTYQWHELEIRTQGLRPRNHGQVVPIFLYESCKGTALLVHNLLGAKGNVNRLHQKNEIEGDADGED